MKHIDELLNKITMYRLAVYVLIFYALLGLVYALLGRLSFSATSMVVSLLLLLVSAYVTDRGLSRWFGVPTNTETWLITALIMFLILEPATSVISGVSLVMAGAFSSASKFVVAYRGKHLFNPAALAAALLSLTGLGATIWWIGGSLFWPFTLVLGLAVVRKIRRFPLVIAFMTTSIALTLVQIVLDHQPLANNLHQALLSSPLIFLGTIMLTEPATMPPRRNQQVLFGALVAVLYVMAWQVGPLIIYPEVALLIGNIYAYIVSPKFRVYLTLKEIQKVSDRVANYIFQPDRTFVYLPGQYMEWTMAGVPYDSRGNRRTFTMASSPTENTVSLGVKFYDPSSTYKATLAELKPGDTVFASQLSGNFTVRNYERKLAFIAGGIGVTPFRSMVKYITDQNLHSDIVVLYVVSDAMELAYVQEFNAAAAVGVRTIPIVTRPGFTRPGIISSTLSPELIAKLIPDYNERLFYISGPNVMVDASKGHLKQLGVGRSNIKTDHFSGY